MEEIVSNPASPMVDHTQIFLGAESNPLLAPRGVFLINNKLLVADTGQNRLFIWNDLPSASYQEPDLVLGQVSPEDTGRNALGSVSASTLLYPSGIWSDGEKLIIADAWNHRVLIWNTFPTKNGQSADIVIGQQDFASNQPNVQGVGHTPTAQSLYWPYGVYSNGEALWIADTGNRRVLFFKVIPTESFQMADGIIGKADFNDRDYDPKHPIWPYSVKIGPKGQMAITDTQYYRVLLWDNWGKAFSEPANQIIGQANFEDNGQNQFGWFPEAHTLNWCYDTCFYEEGIWVADTGNSRVLWFDQLPPTNNAPANNVLGQENFQKGVENRNSIHATEESLYWPFHLCIENKIMVIADTGNHRVIIHHLI
jgi:hypothetical protein